MRSFPRGLAVGAVLSLVTVLGGTAVAGTGVGAVFGLGKANHVNATTTLTGTTERPQLQITNHSTGQKATGLAISVKKGHAPLVLNSSVKVTHLDADLLDGLHATAFQRGVTGSCPSGTGASAISGTGAIACTSPLQKPLTGSCSRGEAINAVSPDGTIGCTSSGTVPLSATLPGGGATYFYVGQDSLEIEAVCEDSGHSYVELQNNGSSAAALNWMYSTGGSSSTVDADGMTLNGFGGAGSAKIVEFTGARIEGQFIFAATSEVATIHLHAYDGGSFCETSGSATYTAP